MLLDYDVELDDIELAISTKLLSFIKLLCFKFNIVFFNYD